MINIKIKKTNNKEGIIINNFHKNILFKINENNCWECYNYATTKDGYPIFKHNNKMTTIARWICENIKNFDMTDMVVRHCCDNPKCINPSHLDFGTRQDNVTDMVIRKRNYCKIEDEKILKTIELYNSGIAQKTISNVLNIDKRYVSRIITGKIWSNLTGIIYKKVKNKSKIQSNKKYITWSKNAKKWRVMIRVKNKMIHLGYFDNIDEAKQIRDKFIKNKQAAV